MRRREFIALAGGAVAMPLAARAQSARPVMIGILVLGNPEPFWSILREALHGLGYVEGRSARFELRSAKGMPSLLPQLASELVTLNVDIIVAWQTPAVAAAKQATQTIPIVMSSGDPVGTGLVHSLSRPGGNITGVSGETAETAAKTVELIRELLPAASRVAVLANPVDPFTKGFLQQIRRVAQHTRIAIDTFMITRSEDYDEAFRKMADSSVNAVVHQPSLPRQRAIDLALAYRLPSTSPLRIFPAAGGLMSYSADTKDLTRRVAEQVDRVLKGARPADLPVELATRFELVINLKTATAIGLTVSPLFLARADEVIE